MMLGGVGRLMRGLGGGTTSFSPISLFSSGEQGLWYDPSDFSTMFQDSAGTTPVTATGQSVGLILDKSKGLALGSNAIVNGNFSTDTDWAKGTNWTISGGLATHSGGTASNIAQSTVVNGQWYVLTFDIVAITDGTLRVRTNNGGATVASFTTTGTKTCYFTSVGAQIGFRAESNTNPISIDNVVCYPIAGNHAIQSVALSRPTFQQEAGGQYYLAFDGTASALSTNTIDFTVTDKVSVFTGVRKLSDVAAAVILELSSTSASNNIFNVIGPNVAGAANFQFNSKGTTSRGGSYTNAAVAAPVTAVLTGLGDITGDRAVLRFNGSQVAISTADQGTGTGYGNFPIYIGARGGTTTFFNGRIYSLVIVGRTASTEEITATESWVNGKTGAY